MGQLSPRITTTELVRLNEKARVPQATEPKRPGAHEPQLERQNPHTTTREKHEKIPHASTKSRVPQLRPDAAKKNKENK